MERLIYPVLAVVLCLFCGCATTAKIVMRDDPLIGTVVRGVTGDLSALPTLWIGLPTAI